MARVVKADLRWSLVQVQAWQTVNPYGKKVQKQLLFAQLAKMLYSIVFVLAHKSTYGVTSKGGESRFWM